jgi:hypothetical protein
VRRDSEAKVRTLDYEQALGRVNKFAGLCERAIWIQQNTTSGFALLPEWCLPPRANHGGTPTRPEDRTGDRSESGRPPAHSRPGARIQQQADSVSGAARDHPDPIGGGRDPRTAGGRDLPPRTYTRGYGTTPLSSGRTDTAGPGRSDRSVRLSRPGEAQPPARYERRRRPDGTSIFPRGPQSRVLRYSASPM